MHSSATVAPSVRAARRTSEKRYASYTSFTAELVLRLGMTAGPSAAWISARRSGLVGTPKLQPQFVEQRPKVSTGGHSLTDADDTKGELVGDVGLRSEIDS